MLKKHASSTQLYKQDGRLTKLLTGTYFGGCWQLPAASAHQFVVQLDDKRAELAHTDEVTAHNVDSLGSWLLLTRPVEKQWERVQRQHPHALERVQEDVKHGLRQVQTSDVKTIWKTKPSVKPVLKETNSK